MTAQRFASREGYLYFEIRAAYILGGRLSSLILKYQEYLLCSMGCVREDSPYGKVFYILNPLKAY